MLKLLTKILPDPNIRKVRSMEPTVDLINSFEPELEKLSDEQLRAKTDEFRQILAKRERSENPKRDRQLEGERAFRPELASTPRDELIAIMLGVHRPTVSLVLKSLREAGLIEEQRGLRQDLAAMPNLMRVMSGDLATLVPSFPAVTWPVEANMLTGKLPFEAKNPMEYIQLHVTAKPKPISASFQKLERTSDTYQQGTSAHASPAAATP